MFTLKFFILFVLAGLCFGDTSVSGPGGQEKEKEEVGSPEKPAGGNGVGGKEDSETNHNGEEQASAGATADPGKRAGLGLPDFIGDPDTRKLYVDALVKECGNISDWKVNERNITASLANCTYICERKNNNGVTEVKRIPKGKICGPNNAKCGETGECPVIVPSC
uniref:Putative secreted protein n=1 Tax=Ixodes ricinus TaxID=34613 RepID=V5ICA4_IXORI